jgi:hypothetical protein
MNFSAEKAGWEIAADGLERPRLFLPISRLEEARPDKKTVSTERGQLFLSADAGAICVGSAPMPEFHVIFTTYRPQFALNRP